MVEEGLKRLSPSSFEILLAAAANIQVDDGTKRD